MELVWRRYMCEENEVWTIARPAHEDAAPEDAICSHGDEAVHVSVEKSIGFVSVGVVPAARMGRGPRDRTQHERRFFVELRAEGLHWISVQMFSWEEALHEVRKYRCLDERRAREMWQRADLGNQLRARSVTREH